VARKFFAGSKILNDNDFSILRRLNITGFNRETRILTMLPPIQKFAEIRAINNKECFSLENGIENVFLYFYFVALNFEAHLKDELHYETLYHIMDEFSHIHMFINLCMSPGINCIDKIAEIHRKIYNFYQYEVLISKKLLENLKELFEERGLFRGMAMSSQCLGDLENRLGAVDSARQNYEDAIEIYKNEQDNLGIANAYSLMGYSYLIEGDMDKAEIYYLQAKPLFLEERENMGLSYNSADLARVYYKKSEKEKAREELKTAMEAAQKSNTPNVVLYVLKAISEVEEMPFEELINSLSGKNEEKTDKE